MNPKVIDMLYVIPAVLRLELIDRLIYILSYLAESCLLRSSRLKTLRQRVGADAAGRSHSVAELLRRRFRQEWTEVSEPVQGAQESRVTVVHYVREKWPLE